MPDVKVIQLGTMCQERASGLSGAPTHAVVNGSGHINYVFQPKMLNPETGRPAVAIRVDESRLLGINIENYIVIDLPTDSIGKKVEDRITGFKGQIIAIVLHLNGCIHYLVQSPGFQKNGSPIEPYEIDPRSCVDAPSSNHNAPVSPGEPLLPEHVHTSAAPLV